ncbi:MAG TPA: FAD-dependent oxidoreductase [bacterium]|nr:FAD-dependent oxidoreductase [bacterium]
MTTCCVVGCGPAGAVLGLLLARAGVDVIVLEKHGDFLRDFRGDTIHPSTLEILDDLGLAKRFLALPHSRAEQFTLRTTAGETLSFDFRVLHTKFPFIVFVPQWDFLNFVTAEARRYPNFRLLMNADVSGLIEESDTVCGVRYRTDAGETDMRALLTIGADGRSSRTRDAAALPRTTTSPPMDVLWFRLSRDRNDPGHVQAILGPGHFIAMFDRGSYWQIAYVIPKDGADAVRAAGLEAFRRSVANLLPIFANRVGALVDWDQIKLLTVRSDRLTRWYRAGYLAIGDAAHAMSPVGGVGINVAIQDAAATANILWRPLLHGSVSNTSLAAVQHRRELSVRITQTLQALMQRQLLVPALAHGGRPPHIPPVIRGALAVPGLRTLLPSLIAFGVFRSRVESPARAAPSN